MISISLKSFPKGTRRQTMAALIDAYKKHVSTCLQYGKNQNGTPIVRPDDFEHFAHEWIAVRLVEMSEQRDIDLNVARHNRREYDVYQSPRDVSLL